MYYAHVSIDWLMFSLMCVHKKPTIVYKNRILLVSAFGFHLGFEAVKITILHNTLELQSILLKCYNYVVMKNILYYSLKLVENQLIISQIKVHCVSLPMQVRSL